MLSSAEAKKKHKYLEACLARHAGFTPLCFSNDGMLGTEVDFFLCHMADRLSAKWERSYSEAIGWIRSRLSYAVLRATLLCVWGSQSRWRSLGIVDGASVSEPDIN